MASDDAATRARANAQTWLDESCGDEPLHDCDDLDWARDVIAAIDGLRAERDEARREIAEAWKAIECAKAEAKSWYEHWKGGSDGE